MTTVKIVGQKQSNAIITLEFYDLSEIVTAIKRRLDLLVFSRALTSIYPDTNYDKIINDASFKSK